MNETEKIYIIENLYKAGEITANGDIFTEEALRQMALQKPSQLKFNKDKQTLMFGGVAGTVDKWRWRSQRTWYKPWTWRLQPIKVIDSFTVSSVKLYEKRLMGD